MAPKKCPFVVFSATLARNVFSRISKLALASQSKITKRPTIKNALHRISRSMLSRKYKGSKLTNSNKDRMADLDDPDGPNHSENVVVGCPDNDLNKKQEEYSPTPKIENATSFKRHEDDLIKIHDIPRPSRQTQHQNTEKGQFLVKDMNSRETSLWDIPQYPSHMNDKAHIPIIPKISSRHSLINNFKARDLSASHPQAPEIIQRRTTDIDVNGNLLYEHLQRPFNNIIDLQDLVALNRSSVARKQLQYPEELMSALHIAHSRTFGDVLPITGFSVVPVSKCQVYLCVEENNHILPFFNVIGTTVDLRLINELAMEKFRDAVYKHFPGLTKGLRPWNVENAWTEANGDIRGMSRFAWWVDRNGCVTLSAAAPGTEYQMDVRVTAQPLALRNCHSS